MSWQRLSTSSGSSGFRFGGRVCCSSCLPIVARVSSYRWHVLRCRPRRHEDGWTSAPAPARLESSGRARARLRARPERFRVRRGAPTFAPCSPGGCGRRRPQRWGPSTWGRTSSARRWRPCCTSSTQTTSSPPRRPRRCCRCRTPRFCSSRGSCSRCTPWRTASCSPASRGSPRSSSRTSRCGRPRPSLSSLSWRCRLGGPPWRPSRRPAGPSSRTTGRSPCAGRGPPPRLLAPRCRPSPQPARAQWRPTAGDARPGRQAPSLESLGALARPPWCASARPPLGAVLGPRAGFASSLRRGPRREPLWLDPAADREGVTRRPWWEAQRRDGGPGGVVGALVAASGHRAAPLPSTRSPATARLTPPRLLMGGLPRGGSGIPTPALALCCVDSACARSAGAPLLRLSSPRPLTLVSTRWSPGRCTPVRLARHGRRVLRARGRFWHGAVPKSA